MSNTDEREPLVLLYQDAYLCVALKPSGMPVQPDTTGDASLTERLCLQLSAPDLGLVHRLDRPVSGAVLLARDAEVLRALNEQFRSRKVAKQYWAIVEGRVTGAGPGTWTILEHTLEHDSKRKKAVVLTDARSGSNRLRYQVLATGDRYSLLEVVPEGGAFHQIRAQMAAAGHAIRGDVKYGARRGEKDRSIALHARSLSFVHPITDRAITVVAPPPPVAMWQVMLALVPGL